jgi:hypothetical protein
MLIIACARQTKPKLCSISQAQLYQIKVAGRASVLLMSLLFVLYGNNSEYQ